MLENLFNLLKRKELIKYLVISELKTSHKGTVLGYLWWLLEPLLLAAIYFFLVTIIFKRGNEDYPVFLFCALLPWQFFTKSIAMSMESISGKALLIKQIAFPKSALPLSIVLSNFVYFMVGSIVLFLMLVFFKISITWKVLLFFPLVILQLIFTLGLAFIFSCLNVYFRDTRYFMQFALKIWFYASPGLYALDMVPEKYQPVYLLNPFAVLFDSYRAVLMRSSYPDLDYLSVTLVLSLAACFFGFAYISANEQKLVKMV